MTEETGGPSMYQEKRDQLTGLIRIPVVPYFDIPYEVRAAFKGMIFRCYPKCGILGTSTLGFPDRGWSQVVEAHGYHVPQEVAIEELRKMRPAAAAWWEGQGYPHKGRNFVFGKDEAEEVRGFPKRLGSGDYKPDHGQLDLFKR